MERNNNTFAMAIILLEYWRRGIRRSVSFTSSIAQRLQERHPNLWMDFRVDRRLGNEYYSELVKRILFDWKETGIVYDDDGQVGFTAFGAATVEKDFKEFWAEPNGKIPIILTNLRSSCSTIVQDEEDKHAA